jgi:serine protease Do
MPTRITGCILTPDGWIRGSLAFTDRITAVDGDKVESASDLTRRVGLAKPGYSLSLDVRRSGKVLKLTLRSGLRPSEDSLAANDGAVPPAEAAEGGLGLLVAPHEGGGVVIQKVSPGTDAADKGLKPGDIIQRAGDSKVSAPADVSAAVAKAKAEGRKAVLLLIVRDGRQIFIPVAIDKPAG